MSSRAWKQSFGIFCKAWRKARHQFTTEQADAAEAKLNAAYQRVQPAVDTASWGTVTKDGIRTAQRAWLRHRGAWIAFAGVRCPAIAPESLRAVLTEKRTVMLEAFLQPS